MNQTRWCFCCVPFKEELTVFQREEQRRSGREEKVERDL